jgi:serine protease Do
VYKRQGIGFAIPVSFVKTVADQLIKQGAVVRGQLGVMLQPLTRELASRYPLDDGQSGILVTEVEAGSPADKAGFRKDDVIISYAGKPVADVGEFRNRVAATSPGSSQAVGVLRNGQRKILAVTIGQLP